MGRLEVDLGVGLAHDGHGLVDDGHEAIHYSGKRHAIDLAAQASTGKFQIAERDRGGARLGLSAGRGDQQVGQRRLGERHRHGVLAGKTQQCQHVGQGAADAALVLGHRDQRQPHLLDLLPEIGGPHALLDIVHHRPVATLGEEASGGLEQHVARIFIHRRLLQRSPRPRATMPRRTWVVPPWMV